MSSINFEVKKIRDPIHKTIGLSELEIEIINTRAFQRLRNIKQLGLVNYVFPGADYTRFSHSIGVCHLSGQLYDAIHKKNGKTRTNYEEKQKYRLAGLLHDIGHYPFSHAMDEALESIYKDRSEELAGLKIKKDSKRRDAHSDPHIYTTQVKYLDHESVGREILLNDIEISEILSSWKFKSKDIYDIFTRNFESLPPDANMISSDLDADRLDYLLRSAYHLGLPYGSADVEYILSQLEIDNDKKICLNSKAIRTIDHFLLCRYFDYSQVIYHKTVAGFEEVLKRIILFFVEETKIKCSMEDVIQKIKNGEWYDFDDHYIFYLIKEYYNKDETPPQIKLMMKSILLRKPPKEIIKLEYIRDSKEKKKFHEKINNMTTIIDDLSCQFDINKNNGFDT